MTERGGGTLHGLLRLTAIVVLLAIALHVGAGLTVTDLEGADVPADVDDLDVPDVGPLDDFGDGPTDDSPDTPTAPETVAELNRSAVESEVHRLVNERRADHGAGRLAFDDDLREIGRYHSRDMSEREYFAHTGPNGTTLQDRYELFGYDCRVSMGDGRYATGGENIFMMQFAAGSHTEAEIAKRAVDGWMNSTDHRENMLAEYWQREGIGVYVTQRGDEVSVYVTQNFC